MRTPKNLAKSLGLSAAIVALTTVSSFAAVATASVNVRSGPGIFYRVVDQLYRGERVRITGHWGNWCRISHTGPDRWVACAYLTDGRPNFRPYPGFFGPSITFNFGFGGTYPPPPPHGPPGGPGGPPPGGPGGYPPPPPPHGM
jgi:hypothetical protein